MSRWTVFELSVLGSQEYHSGYQSCLTLVFVVVVVALVAHVGKVGWQIQEVLLADERK